MKSIAWAIIVASFIMMPESREPLQPGVGPLIAVLFAGSVIGFFMSLRDVA